MTTADKRLSFAQIAFSGLLLSAKRYMTVHLLQVGKRIKVLSQEK